ncbi:MAG TPA: YihY/virulence factor BrkB family protein [Gemmatimonadaceae bacterium]|jgi:membrane protein|nr:YihY/virulence factor BrkB family protein [Gemmatimonadaceae bacterium]
MLVSTGEAMVIKGYNVVPLVKKTVEEIGEDRIPSLAAQTAYYFFFSLFPLLLFLTPMLGLIGNGQELMQSLLGRLSTTMPADTLSLVRRVLGEIVTSSGNAGVMSVGVLLAGWSGSNIFGALMDALNQAYDVSETRPWWKKQVLRVGVLLIAGGIMIVATGVFLDGERLAQWAGRALHLGNAAVLAWSVLQVVFAVALLVALGAIVYKLLPNVQQRWAHVIICSAITTLLWIVATLAFRFYVQHFGSYNKTYGTIGAVIMLLTWMYYSMFVVLVGGELAAEIHHGTGAVGPEKGAIYYGRIVSESGPGRPSLDKGRRPV